MTNTFPLKSLLDLSQNRMDDAARKLGELISSEQEGARKLELLQNYRAEYEDRFHEAARNGMSPEAWRNYSNFIARIDDAIDVQRACVEQAKHMTSAGQHAWLAQRNKVKAFDALQQRHVAGETRKEAKREQRMLDEHTAKRYRDRDESSDS
jgi:flagellar FliJ protein